MHPLLKRQLRKHSPHKEETPEDWQQFIDAVNEAYFQSDSDRAMLERSLDLSSEELLQTNSELRAIIQAFPDLFIRTDKQGLILDRKGGSEEDPFLSQAKNLRGKNVRKIPVRDVASKFDMAFQQLRETKKLAAIQYQLGTEAIVHHYEARLLPLALEDQVMIIVRNMTELKRAELALEEKATELMRSNQDLQQFAYIASHDLQEPLRTVQSYMQLLKRRYKEELDENAHEFINFAVDGAQRMRSLIEDLLAYARVSSRARPPLRTDLNVLIADVTELLIARITETKAKIHIDPLPTVMADAPQLRQLFQNLITNALKFIKPEVPPEITFSATEESGMWKIAVKDNGIGISPDFSEKIFDIFRRLHTREEYTGTGMGLAICKKIAERHGGTIWVESEPNEGACFIVSLPNENNQKALGSLAGKLRVSTGDQGKREDL